jgi:hypothetical protein
LFASGGALPVRAESPSDVPDMSDCHSDTPFVAQCLPLRTGETLALIVDVVNRSKGEGAVDASFVEGTAVQVLTEGLEAPGVGPERARTDVKITSHSTNDLATLAWTPQSLETTTTVLLQCSLDDIRLGAAGSAMVAVACRMTRGRMNLAGGWMTGYQNYSGEPMVAPLTGRPDTNKATLRTLLQRVFRKMIYVSRLGR